jgi:hypothetical protein
MFYLNSYKPIRTFTHKHTYIQTYRHTHIPHTTHTHTTHHTHTHHIHHTHHTHHTHTHMQVLAAKNIKFSQTSFFKGNIKG